MGLLLSLLIGASARQADNLRALPIHLSQREIEVQPDGRVLFEYYLVPSSTFIGEIMMMQGSLEVIYPSHLRDSIRKSASVIMIKHK